MIVIIKQQIKENIMVILEHTKNHLLTIRYIIIFTYYKKENL